MILLRKLTILVDMDDTIENLIGTWVEYLNERFGTSVSHEDITEWDMTKAFPSLTKAEVFSPIFENDFWKRVPPIDGAAEALQKLIEEGHRVIIVTASAYQTLAVKMDDVLFRYFPFLSWDNVIITSQKQLIRGDVLVDDGIHNLEGGKYYKILVDGPHNRYYDAKANGMFRATSWKQIYEVIEDIANTPSAA